MFSNEIPEGYFMLWARKLNGEKFTNYIVDQTDDERITEIDIILQHAGGDRIDYHTFLFSDLENEDTSWLSRTSIPLYCTNDSQFIKDLHQELNNKYAKKSSDLASILLQKFN